MPHFQVGSKEEADEKGKELASKTDATIALITEQYKKEGHHPELKKAEEEEKPMFAIVERGIDWGEYKIYPWIKVFKFSREEIINRNISVERAMEEIKDWLDSNI